mgnify:CR=1 FL=1
MKNKYFILAGFLILVLFIFMIVIGDPYFTIAGIILGVIFVLIIIADIIEHFFPKNRLSKRLEKTAEWIKDNIR